MDRSISAALISEGTGQPGPAAIAEGPSTVHGEAPVSASSAVRGRTAEPRFTHGCLAPRMSQLDTGNRAVSRKELGDFAQWNDLLVSPEAEVVMGNPTTGLYRGCFGEDDSGTAERKTSEMNLVVVVAIPSRAAYMHMGETPIRLGITTPRAVNGSNSAGSAIRQQSRAENEERVGGIAASLAGRLPRA